MQYVTIKDVKTLFDHFLLMNMVFNLVSQSQLNQTPFKNREGGLSAGGGGIEQLPLELCCVLIRSFNQLVCQSNFKQTPHFKGSVGMVVVRGMYQL